MVDHFELEADWRKLVLDELQLGLAEVFIVEDPDNLMVESGIQKALASRAYNFYHYDESVALRHFYETKIRLDDQQKQSVVKSSLVISLDNDSPNARDLPFDILSHARIVSFSLSDCFPDIYPSVLSQLESEELDALHRAIIEFTPGKLGDLASRDFVMRHVFHVAAEVIQSPSDLLRTLLRLNYRDIALPLVLKERLISTLKRRSQFKDWPLSEIIGSKNSFYAFLQHNWSAYVQAVIDALKTLVREPIARYQVTAAKVDVILPFGHDDVRVYIDNYFLEGLLQPIKVDDANLLKDHWCRVGIQIDIAADNKLKAEKLLDLCQKTLPAQDDRHQIWYQFASRWAELCALYHFQPELLDRAKFKSFQTQLDQRFMEWMLANYSGLINHPPSPPAMLHHVPKQMARELSDNPDRKVALIVVDGLALDQWVTIRNEMNLNLSIDESCVFAWVPTVTSVSRQALFAAKAPFHFPNSIFTTSTESKSWRNFWLEQGLHDSQVYYEKSLDIYEIDLQIEKLSDHRLRVVGLVINTVDDMMHGMKIGAAGMQNQVKLWAKNGYLLSLLTALNKLGFSIYLTADHGNVEAIGSGKISEGAVAESRGERTRVYKTESLRNDIALKYVNSNDVVSWPQNGLPTDFWPLVMTGRSAFVAQGEHIVGHGGITIEEVIVPYIRILRTR